MYLKNKRVLVVGLGISGLSTVKALKELDAKIYLYDSKDEDTLSGFLIQIKDIYFEKYLNGNRPILDNIDLIIKSPGVPLDIPILKEAKDKNIEVITDLELAYRINHDKNIIAITGTNGKTTTTKLTGELFEKSGYNTYVLGNIGVGILDNMINTSEDDIFIIEASSFQLEHTHYFKPKVSVITNITPDHISWHGSLENYIEAKKKIYINQDMEDYTILNYDDLTLRDLGRDIKSNIIWFSIKESLDKGVFIEDGYVVVRRDGKTTKILALNDIQIPGNHNLENILASIAIAWVMGVKIENMSKAVREFKGVEHRIEYVKTVDGMNFYNDSKGTNPDSTIKAIEALKSPIILIAGGYDKGSEYDQLIQAFNDKVKTLILLGQTKDKISKSAADLGFKDIHLVENMEEAVKIAYKLGEKEDNILLSPACASWGMYNNFEERGDDFKNIVNNLQGDYYG